MTDDIDDYNVKERIMKSYIRFLSRNKLYTAIMVVGLSVSLAFVILLGAHLADKLGYDRSVDTKGLYLCHVDYTGLDDITRSDIFNKLPQVEEVSYFRQYNSFNGLTGSSNALVCDGKKHCVDGIVADASLLTIFPFDFIVGSAETALQDIDDIIISESFAKKVFSTGVDDLGRNVSLDVRGYENKIYTITGIYKDLKKWTLKPVDYIFLNENKDMSGGAIEPDAAYFVRLQKGTDEREFKEILQGKFNEGVSFKSQITVTPITELRGQSDNWYINSFNNSYDGDVIDVYMIMCLFITIVSMMNYIALTIAFSRFRLKEIATRRLLGTGRSAIVFRCIFETSIILSLSAIIAVLIAFALKDVVSNVIGTDLTPMSNLTELVVLCGLIIFTSIIAGIIPSVVLSVKDPLKIVKGEQKHRDKMYLSKVFILIEGGLSLFSIAVTIAIMMQTFHLINYPRGYNTDGLVYVSFQGSKKADRYYDEFLSQSYVDMIGMVDTPLMGVKYSMLGITDEAGNKIECFDFGVNDTSLELLGIEILKRYSDEPLGNYLFYITESSADRYGYTIKDNKITNHRTGFKIPVAGVVTDFDCGNIKSSTNGMICLQVHEDKDYLPVNTWDNLLVKVTGDEREDCGRINDFYTAKGYDDTIFKAETLNDILRKDFTEERQSGALMFIFALVSLLLTSIAIIALSSYYAELTKHDIAIRKVLGEEQYDIFWSSVWRFASPVAFSGLIAIPVAYVCIERWLEGFPVQIDNSPAIYLTTLIIVMIVVLASVAYQGTRLMRTNPAEALKKE